MNMVLVNLHTIISLSKSPEGDQRTISEGCKDLEVWRLH